MDRTWTHEQPAVFSASERKSVKAPPAPAQAASEAPAGIPAGMPAGPKEPPAQPEAFSHHTRAEMPAQMAAANLPQTERREKAARASRITTVLAVVFLAGVGYGAILSGMLDRDTAAALEQITRGFLSGRAESGFWEVFLRALGTSLLLGCAVFLSGFSAVGQPFAVFILLFRAVGLGMSMGYFYTVLSGEGILLALFLLLPAGALSGYALLLGCREALRLSGRFFGAMTKGTALSPKTFRIYAVKFLIIALMLVLAALLDAGCTRLFQAFWAK